MLVPLLVAVLTVSVAAQSGHPEFDPPMEEVVLEEGSSAKVECRAKGEMPLVYTWYNTKEAKVTSDEKQEIYSRQSEQGYALIFPEVKRSHAGLYSCSAENKHGTASKPYDIIVNISSGNITNNESAEIRNVEVVNIAENSIEFAVTTTGDPDSFYIIYREKLNIKEEWVQIKKGEKVVVKDLVPAGVYELRFQIEPPSRSKRNSTLYYVTLLPSIPDVIFRNIKDNFVDVEWFRSIDDLSRESIEEYELTYNTVRVTGGKTWEESNCAITVRMPFRHCSPTRYTIAGLQTGIYYEIRLRMRTSSGYGKAYTNKVYIL